MHAQGESLGHLHAALHFESMRPDRTRPSSLRPERCPRSSDRMRERAPSPSTAKAPAASGAFAFLERLSRNLPDCNQFETFRFLWWLKSLNRSVLRTRLFSFRATDGLNRTATVSPQRCAKQPCPAIWLIRGNAGPHLSPGELRGGFPYACRKSPGCRPIADCRFGVRCICAGSGLRSSKRRRRTFRSPAPC